jgi:hypothetical protein
VQAFPRNTGEKPLEVVYVPNRIKSVLDGIVTRFETGDVPEAVAISTFPISDTPSSRWSFLNRLIMYLAGTADARGFRQWQKAKRHVKKGAKALYILVPDMVRIETNDGDEEPIVRGFLARPVSHFSTATVSFLLRPLQMAICMILIAKNMV